MHDCASECFNEVLNKRNYCDLKNVYCPGSWVQRYVRWMTTSPYEVMQSVCFVATSIDGPSCGNLEMLVPAVITEAILS